MKTIQKTSLFAILFFNLATGFNATAQVMATPPSSLNKHSAERIVRNYIQALRSPNHGVVESALFNALSVVALRPDARTQALEREIAKLEESGHTPAIRYKSVLTRYVLIHPELLAEINPKQFEHDAAYFQALTMHLGTKLLSDPEVAVK